MAGGACRVQARVRVVSVWAAVGSGTGLGRVRGEGVGWRLLA